MYAAGLTMKIENIPAFRERFEEIVTRQITSVQQIQSIDVDAKIALSEITPKFYHILRQFAPYGPHNMTPVFVTEDVFDAGTSRLVGKTQEHIKLDLVEPDVNSGIFPGIAFNQSQAFEAITSGTPFDICYTIVENEYRGKTSLQLYIKDIKIRDIF
jgi:single-stranded-DNA-specific exonuclease